MTNTSLLFGLGLHTQPFRLFAFSPFRLFTFSPLRANDPAAVAEVTAANSDFAATQAAGLSVGDQPWDYCNKAYRSTRVDAARAVGWSDADIQTSINRVADGFYMSENWEDLVARGVDIFCLPGSHGWVAYNVPSASTIVPNLRTYILLNGSHNLPSHPEAPIGDQVKAAFFAEKLFG